MTQRRPIAERFWFRVDRRGPNECWEWIGYRTRDGYGSFWNGQRRPGPGRPTPVMVLAHRWIYEQEVGPIPPGNVVLHHCDNPPCVNPAHLAAGTQRENVHDSILKGRHATGRRVITPAEEDEVRSLYRGEYGDMVRLAAQFGVHKKVIKRVVAGLPRVGRLAR